MAGDGPMRVRVRLFARQRELAGTREVAFDLAAGATIEDAWAALAARFPAIASGRPFVRFARNGDYAEAGTALADGDEVACIPPISGGADAGDPAGWRPRDPSLRAARGAVSRPRSRATLPTPSRRRPTAPS